MLTASTRSSTSSLLRITREMQHGPLFMQRMYWPWNITDANVCGGIVRGFRLSVTFLTTLLEMHIKGCYTCASASFPVWVSLPSASFTHYISTLERICVNKSTANAVKAQWVVSSSGGGLDWPYFKFKKTDAKCFQLTPMLIQ